MLEFVTAIARDAGALLRAEFRRDRHLDFKSRAEIVTDMDLASERLIIECIAARFPEHHIISEEGGGDTRSSRWVWLVDPLDGTNNYAHGQPFFAVSIALLKDDALQLGVVFDPIHDECFTATSDDIARLNGQPIRVSSIDDLRAAQLSTGFPYDRWSRPDTNVPETAAMVMQCQDLRRMGSAALDLCAVAAGRSEGHWEVELKPWDSAAGALILRAAGGEVSDLYGGPYSPWTRHVVASNGRVHRAMLDVLATARVERV